ncbi:MAG: winged helix-turn-helix transcriptional regulator [Methylobacteriaceae bacterium]|nr:winged helix-turn-helix transcriptional regulator [Methylobacteriaceae bacterium]
MIERSLPPQPDAFLGYTVVRLAHVLEKRFERRLRAGLGISVRQFGALVHLQRDPGISSARLARLLLITPQSAGPLLGAMEAAGLVSREPPAKNGSRMRVKPTARGEELLAQGYAITADANDSDFLDISPTECKHVNQLLRTVLARLMEEEY